MKRLILSIVLAILCGISAFAYDFSKTSNGVTLYYTITSSSSPYKVKVVSQNTTSPYYSTYPTGNLTIPSSVTYNSKTYSVTSIDSKAFYNCSGLTSVTIPSSVTSIGSDAFYSCSGLTKVNYTGTIAQWCGITFGNYNAQPLYYAHNLYISNSLVSDLAIPSSVAEIKGYAFQGATCLTSVTIPSSVTSIGSSAFYGCSGLSFVTIGNSVASIGGAAFCNCSGLTSVTLPNSVTSIGSGAFRGCSGLTEPVYNANCFAYFPDGYAAEYTIPNGIQQIVGESFCYCREITSITIPTSVISIDYYAFGGCSGLAIVNFNATSCTSVGISVWSGCSSLSTINIGENVTIIPAKAFYGCSALDSITIPNSVTSIGDYAFSSCSALDSIAIPNSVMSIGNYAFNECRSLTRFIFGNSVTSIGDYAFFYCTGLKSIAIGSSVENIGRSAFVGCSNLLYVTIPNSVTSIAGSVFQNCRDLETVLIPNTVTTIGDYAFENVKNIVYNGTATGSPWGALTVNGYVDGYLIYSDATKTNLTGCSALATSVNIPNSVESIGNYAFSRCDSLESVTIPNSVTSIGEYAFSECTGMESIAISNSITSIEYSLFSFCYNLKSITIPNSVETIGLWAFSSCRSLKTITIGNSVTEIGNYAFDGCDSITDVYVKTATPPAGRVTPFGYGTIVANLWVPCGSVTSYTASDIWRVFSSISESRAYMLDLSSSNIQQGSADIISQPNCTNGTAIISATPAEGYSFAQWNDGNTDNPRMITVTSDTSFTASFGALRTITVASADETMGTVSGSGVYADGSQATISATANEHYHFVQWNDENTDNPRTITVAGDVTYTATFAIDQFAVTVESANEIMGTVSGRGTYNYGTETQITATANEHYHFVSWNDGNTDNPRTITVESDTTFTATFAANEFTITVATETSRTNSEPTFIPDGPNCTTQCYTSDITFSDFNEDAVVDNADAIKYVRLNMEHSFIGDLQIKITCPEDANHNHRSAIMLQDYYSSDSESDVFSDNAIDPYTYVWPDRVTSTRWHVGRSATNWYTGQHMIGRYEVFEDQNEAYTTGGYTYYLASFSSGTDARDFITNYLSRYYSGREYAVYMIQDALYYVIGYTEGDEGYIVWLTRDNTTGDNAFSFPSQEAAQYFLNNVYGGDGVISSYSIDGSYRRISFGEPDYYDVRDANNITSGQICDDTDPHNLAGIGYDYAWTSNSQYNTIGYVYDSENIATPSIFYDNGVISDTSLYHVMPSDVETGVQMYQPFQSFNNLVGCPLNGTWTISVCDSWAYDNGYVFDWEIAISGDGNNIGTVAGGGTYNEGEEISISATPAEHYHFVSWNDGNTENPRIVTVAEDATYSAIFAIDQHTIMVESADEAFGTVSGGGTYDYGTESQISATANEHYHFVRWNDGNTENPRTITVAGDVTYTATFAIDQFAVTVESANEIMGTVSGSGTYNYGTETQISATANEHYHFVQWNDGNTENPRTITVAEEATYTAEFTIDQHTITVVSSNETMGAVSGGGTFEYGIETQISAIPAEHHHFVSWNDGNTENPRTITVFADTTYTATFAVDVTNYTITAVSANPNYGTVTGGGTYAEGTEITLTAMPNEGYEFVQWNDESTENPRTITVTENAIYIATFAAATIPTIYNEFTAATCESYTWNDSIYTESGDYTQTFMAASSADSIVTLHLTIYPLPQPEITVAGILDACNPETASVTLSTEEYDSYVWSNGEITSAIEVTEPNVYYVEVVDGHGCHGVSEMTTVGYSSVLTEAPQIRLVGMSSSGKNVLLWNVASTEGIAGYEIYREDNVANVFNCIDRIERPNARNYIDLTSEPGARAYRYRICSFDECGGRSPMSDFHKTMHLTINRGVGTNWNLIWSHYEGLEFDTYKIYRGTSPRDMVMIGEMPSTLNSFTDLTNTLEEGMYYRVEIVTNNGAKNEDVSLSSNIVANEYVDEYTITVLSYNVNIGSVYGGGTYPALLDITLAAIPNAGYEFVSWSDGNTDNPRVITVTENATYIATFAEAAPIETYTITAVSANPDYGRVIGGGTYPAGTIVTLSAEANDGYQFVAWSDNSTENPREITVTGDATYVASFVPVTGIEENTNLEISLFPNPATDIINISSSETISEIEIVNTLGQVVYRKEINGENAVCDVEGLTAGVYIVRIHGTDTALVCQRKFIKE